MAAAGQDAMILYTNFIRSAAVSHLVGFSPYWADGVLLVPRDGEPVFATTLSKRVGSWIQTVKPVGDLVNTPAPGKVIGERLAKARAFVVSPFSSSMRFPAGSTPNSPPHCPASSSSTGPRPSRPRARPRMPSSALSSNARTPSPRHALSAVRPENRHRPAVGARRSAAHGCTVPKRSMSRLHRTSISTAAFSGCRARVRWAAVSRSVRPLPTKGAGSGAYENLFAR